MAGHIVAGLQLTPLGQLLFAAANAMRLAGVDAEEALTFASKRFCKECLEQENQSGTQVE